MIIRRLAPRRLVPNGSTAEQPARRRAGGFLLAIVAAGTIAGAASWLDVGPFGNVHAFIHDVLDRGTSEVPAVVIFPAVQPVHRTVDVYDPPPPARAAPPAVPPAQTGAPGAGDAGEPGDGGGGDN